MPTCPISDWFITEKRIAPALTDIICYEGKYTWLFIIKYYYCLRNIKARSPTSWRTDVGQNQTNRHVPLWIFKWIWSASETSANIFLGLHLALLKNFSRYQIIYHHDFHHCGKRDRRSSNGVLMSFEVLMAVDELSVWHISGTWVHWRFFHKSILARSSALSIWIATQSADESDMLRQSFPDKCQNHL